ncbi:alpha/beta fold hydrolase [Aquisalimonas asiatica]|uniref:Pimeloyl-ACP methyl ester carboxylesterase n=1 Tax=Aquisalimonas asiatica TaxID=406100 RepID=A0A1H8S213_9GAMM|nr:alpha/beta hydrolase [Aquisalimonas asiatica]SEO72576.1 Pimeloyl-ACP methyl ester carboxylesterase [Aquisalimonas asiatica]
MDTDEVIARNNVRIVGEGERTLMLAHGFGCDQTIWRRLLPWFEADHRIVLFDYVGSGGSDAGAYDPRRYGRIDGYAQDVVEICRALDLREAVLVGHSISAMIGLRATIRAPEHFSGLVMIGASPRYCNDPPGFTGGFDREDILSLLDMMEHNFASWARMLAPTVMQNPEQPELTDELAHSLAANTPGIAREFAEVAFLSDNRDLLPRATVPSLIIHCTDDALARPEVGEYLQQHTPGSTLRMIEASGHFPHVSAPEATASILRDYLRAPPSRNGR